MLAKEEQEGYEQMHTKIAQGNVTSVIQEDVLRFEITVA